MAKISSKYNPRFVDYLKSIRRQVGSAEQDLDGSGEPRRRGSGKGEGTVRSSLQNSGEASA